MTFCCQIQAPATVPNYVHIHLMNNKFLAKLYSSKPRMFVFMPSYWRLSFPSEETCYAFRWLLWPRIQTRSLIHSAKRCCYMNYTCDSVLRIGNFFLCITLSTTPCKELRHLVTDIWHWPYPAVKVETHFMRTVAGYILLLKRTNDTIQIVYGFCNAFVTFQFSFCPILEGRFVI